MQGVSAYDFFRVPSWVFPTAAVMCPDGREATIVKIDWMPKMPEVYYRVDGETNDRRTTFMDFVGRSRPLFGSDGMQRIGSAATKRATPLLELCAWSNRAINIIKREGWDRDNAGEFLATVSVEILKDTRGAGKGIVTEFLKNFAEAGLKMRRFEEEEEIQ